MVAQPRGDEPPVIGDRRAVTGQQSRRAASPRALEALEVAQARARTAVLRPVGRADLRVRGDRRQEVIADERDRVASSTSSVSVVLWPGPRHDAEAAPARAHAIAVGQPHVGLEGLGRRADVVPERPRCRRSPGRARRGGSSARARTGDPPRPRPSSARRSRPPGPARPRSRPSGAGSWRRGRRGRDGDASRAAARCPRRAAPRAAGRASSADSAPSSRGPVSISVTGSPGSSQAFTEPTCAQRKGYGDRVVHELTSVLQMRRLCATTGGAEPWACHSERLCII